MESWREVRRRWARRAAVAAAASTTAVVLAAGSPASTASLENPRPLPLFVKGAIKRSVALALDRLKAEECRAIFTDFEDMDGRPLAEKLERAGTSPADHLASLEWVNGSQHPTCRNPNIFFVTVVGGDRIYVCPKQFSEYATTQPIKAAGLVLHEELHSLGLGENPPTSIEISRQVFARCGR